MHKLVMACLLLMIAADVQATALTECRVEGTLVSIGTGDRIRVDGVGGDGTMARARLEIAFRSAADVAASDGWCQQQWQREADANDGTLTMLVNAPEDTFAAPEVGACVVLLWRYFEADVVFEGWGMLDEPCNTATDPVAEPAAD